MVNLITWMLTMHPLRTLGALLLGITILILVLTGIILSRTTKKNPPAPEYQETKLKKILV